MFSLQLAIIKRENNLEVYKCGINGENLFYSLNIGKPEKPTESCVLWVLFKDFLKG